MQHKILVGDMNVTIYSRWFNKLLAISGLENNGTEQLLNPSWSPLTKRSFWAGLRIDHLLTTPSINVLAQTIGPDYGSDHLPIITRLQFSDETVKGE